MQKIDIRNPSEQKKLIWAVVLGVVAIVFLWWTFFGFGGGSNPTSKKVVAITNASPVSRPVNKGQPETVLQVKGDLLNQLRPVVNPQTIALSVPEAKRNIFAYYEPPPAPAQSVTPTPTPTPTPPVLLAAVSPANVYARTSDFSFFFVTAASP